MGIRHLWMALAPASHHRTLTQFTVSEGFEQNRRRGWSCLPIGIDASIWMNEVQLAVQLRKGKGIRLGENPAVRILFYRLARLLALPVIPVFVFDGRDRPPIKRGVAVDRVRSHWLTLPFQRFIEAFGFHWYTAPGEAEAELAELNRRHIIDAIVSEDSDTVVFGAGCVIRMDDGDQITVFDAKALQSHPDVLLDHGALFIMAILCGGDYDSVGLDGCRWRTACQIARTELGHSLFTAAISLSPDALNAFLPEWRQAFRTLLAHNPDRLLEAKHPVLAQRVTEEFPSVDVLLLYAQPVTSWTKERPPDHSQWGFQQPYLAEIGNLCERYFSWGTLGELVPRWQGTLFPGVAIRFLIENQGPHRLHEALLRYDQSVWKKTPSISNLHVFRIFQARLGPGPRSTSPDVSGYTIQVSAFNILCESIAKLDSELQRLAKMPSDPAVKTSFWIPQSIFNNAMPDVVARFRGKLAQAPPAYASILSPLPSSLSVEGAVPRNLVLTDPCTGSPTPPLCISSTTRLAMRCPSIQLLDFIDLSLPSPPPTPASHAEFVEGSSNGRTPALNPPQPLPTPLDSDPDVEFIGGPYKKSMTFLGFIDLCSPSPPPNL